MSSTVTQRPIVIRDVFLVTSRAGFGRFFAIVWARPTAPRRAPVGRHDCGVLERPRVAGAQPPLLAKRRRRLAASGEWSARRGGPAESKGVSRTSSKEKEDANTHRPLPPRRRREPRTRPAKHGLFSNLPSHSSGNHRFERRGPGSGVRLGLSRRHSVHGEFGHDQVGGVAGTRKRKK